LDQEDNSNFKVLLEEDGTEIDEDEMMHHYSSAAFLLLRQNESWEEYKQGSIRLEPENVETVAPHHLEVEDEGPHSSQAVSLTGNFKMIIVRYTKYFLYIMTFHDNQLQYNCTLYG
jgi:hypothetical protein